ncbi:DUF262 domain-containing HNH endonuclease family protein [Acidimicrobiales bacterium]|nr:DUF262 domain-containing HNH endonuclease family protein [Acidimicrobiales bacterium]
MEANALTPRDLFDGKVCYEIPPFQRPYVWTEEDQWQPLWNDIARVAEVVLKRTPDSDAKMELSGHFLGAVVLKQLASGAGDPARSSVIDGQQRLTTLQLVLDAAQLVMEEAGYDDLAESIFELVVNDSKRFRGTAKRFKLWPSRIDRQAFEHAMDNDKGVPEALEDSRIVQAHRFFVDAMTGWSTESSDPPDEQIVGVRLAALAEVLQQHLQIVAIDLSSSDDDQLIFETLNDRGTPLLAADLIKNYVFQRCDELGADVDTWGELYWADFDNDWWRDEIAQGRLLRSKIDLFLQYWLTMRVKEEIPTDAVFAQFRQHADEHLRERDSAESFLAQLRQDADTFREFAQLDPRTAQGSFYARVIEALEMGVFIPLLLWVITDAHRTSPEQADRALGAVESWAVRRTLLRRTMKDVNRLVVALLKELDSHPSERVGDATIEYLRAQTADARTWPTDKELVTELPGVKVYGNIKQQRLRAILSGVELQLRTVRHEDVSLPEKLDIEHVMPRGWRTYWQDGLLGDPEACANRDIAINTIGNLTLVTKSLNSTLSNRPWKDDAAATAGGRGADKGLGKRSLLNKYSVLALSREIVDDHPESWSEADIYARSVAVARAIADAWPVG